MARDCRPYGRGESRIERIADHIAADNPGRAVTFIEELLERSERLADMPRSYPLVPRYEHTGVRRRPHGDYLIFYRIGTDRSDILHLLNGARHYEGILFPTE